MVETAIAFIDRHGLRHLTMRRLGETLDVEAMSLYKHVRGRDQLLDLIVESVLDELYGDPSVRLQPRDGDWQTYLRRLAEGLRRIALGHPQVFPLVATRPPAAYWVRPPIRSLRWINELGHLLLEVAQLDIAIGPEEQKQVDCAHPGVEEVPGHPTVRSLGKLLAENTSDREFRSGLDSLLERLEDLRASSGRVGDELTRGQ